MLAAFEAPESINGEADNVAWFVEDDQFFINSESGNAIQQAIDAALDYALTHAIENTPIKLTIMINNGSYTGGLMVKPADGAGVVDNLELTIQAHDARDADETTWLSSATGVKFAGNITIDYSNIQLILAGLYLSLESKITADNAKSVTYYGTKGDDSAYLYINGQTSGALYGGEGEDNLTVSSNGDYYATGRSF